MTFSLPIDPKPLDLQWSYVSNGIDLVGPLGGADQRVTRLGDRWSVQVIIRATKAEGLGRPWMKAIAKSTTDTVLMPVYQRGLNIGSPGTPLVNGGAQAGTSLAIDGLKPNYRFKDGQMFSFLGPTGRNYLHMVDGDQTASAAGVITLTFLPMLRASPSDNTAVAVGKPMIEGFVQGMTQSWSQQRDRLLALTFTLKEKE